MIRPDRKARKRLGKEKDKATNTAKCINYIKRKKEVLGIDGFGVSLMALIPPNMFF